MQFKVAEQFSQLMRTYPVGIPTAYSGDYGNEWTHLILTYVIQVSCLIQLSALHGWSGFDSLCTPCCSCHEEIIYACT